MRLRIAERFGQHPQMTDELDADALDLLRMYELLRMQEEERERQRQLAIGSGQ